MARTNGYTCLCLVLACFTHPTLAHERHIEARTLLAFDPALGQLPESLTVDNDGSIFLSMSNGIVRVDEDLQLESYAVLPLPTNGAYFALGVKVGPDGCLYSLSGAFATEPSGAFLWRICDRNQVEQLAAFDPTGFPNDLAFDDAGRIYVTDPFLGRIWRILPSGEVQVWLDDARLDGDPNDPALPAHDFGVDGIAFDARQNGLYLGNLDYGEIYRVNVRDDGSAGDLELVVRSPLLRGADGMAFDVAGTLYVAVNGQDHLVTLSRCGGLSVPAQGFPLDAPSSLAFGVRHADKRVLYVSSFAINRALGVPAETPHPALIALDVARPGLPLM